MSFLLNLSFWLQLTGRSLLLFCPLPEQNRKQLGLRSLFILRLVLPLASIKYIPLLIKRRNLSVASKKDAVDSLVTPSSF